MTIQDWGAIGELVGGAAVIVTLIYLALQLRDNTRAVRLDTSHTVIAEFRGMFDMLSTCRELAEIVVAAATDPDSLTGADKLQYWTYNNSFMRAVENAYFQWSNGALDEAQWRGMQAMVRDYVHTAGFAEFWQNRGHWYSSEFQRVMETELLSGELQPGVILPGNY